MNRWLGFGCVIAVTGFLSAGIASPAQGRPTGASRTPPAAALFARPKCPAWPTGSGILVDGDFQDATDPGPYSYRLYAGFTFGKGWTVSRGDVDFYGSGAWHEPAPNDICTVDLDGAKPGRIRSKAFPTTPGAMYTVTFLLSGNPDCTPQIKKLQVRAAAQAQRFTWDISRGHDAQHGIYESETWTFTAISASTTLEFVSADGKRSPRCGPVVGAISVTQT